MKRTLAACLALLMLLCAACSDNSSSQAAAEAKQYAISFIDDDGIEINLEEPAQRIISLYSAHTENLYSLKAGEQVIGGHTTCVYPPEAAKTAVYDYNGDPETVIAADPDVVLIRPFIRRKAPNFVSQLERVGITVVSLYPESYDDFPEYINRLSMICGKQENAAALLSDMQRSINSIVELTADITDKQTVFFEATEVNIRTVCKNSMPDRAIHFAGGINLAEGAEPMTQGSTIAQFGVEQVLQHADDIDVYISQRGAMNAGGNLISIGERAGYDTVKAVKEGRVYTINEKLISSPTFRYAKGVREVARYLYPSIMDDLSPWQTDSVATRADFADIAVRSLHIPIYLPSSSKYYRSEQKGHTYGMFEDVSWIDPRFDNIETAVYSGYIEYEKAEDKKEYFYPEGTVSREELAQAVFVAGDFSMQENNTPIKDIDDCQKPRIVQCLVDNGAFETEDGKFDPRREVTCAEIVNAFSFIK